MAVEVVEQVGGAYTIICNFGWSKWVEPTLMPKKVISVVVEGWSRWVEHNVVLKYIYTYAPSITIIRGEPERAPNTRVTYGEFAVPMYVCIYVCSDTSSTCS